MCFIFVINLEKKLRKLLSCAYLKQMFAQYLLYARHWETNTVIIPLSTEGDRH